jgi:hypothetical protein
MPFQAKSIYIMSFSNRNKHEYSEKLHCNLNFLNFYSESNDPTI